MAVNRQGSILVTTLWIIAIISLLALGVGFRSSLDLRLSKYSLDKLRASYLARAGVLKAEELILAQEKTYDSLYQCGFQLTGSQSPKDLFSQEANKLEAGSFEISYPARERKSQEAVVAYGPMDEERKFNINLSKTAPLDKLNYARIFKGLSPLITDEIINSIIDWQDEDSDVSSPGAAEQPYYAYLDSPYQCRNSDFLNIEELLMVKGVTAEVYDQIKDQITTNSNGKINVNTASFEVLEALINDQDDNYGLLIERILEYRQGPDAQQPTADDQVFFSLGGLKLLAQTPQEEERLQSLSSFVVFKSSNYRVISQGNIDRVKRTIECVFHKLTAQDQTELKYYHEY